MERAVFFPILYTSKVQCFLETCLHVDKGSSTLLHVLPIDLHAPQIIIDVATHLVCELYGKIYLHYLLFYLSAGSSILCTLEQC
jgi:hypothetical protein